MPRHAAVWPARLPLRMNPPATPLWANLSISAWRYPEKAALVFMGKCWTYRELMAASEQIAGHLARLGVRKGDRVQVLSGKDRGKTGTVTRAIPEKDRVIVDGVNIAKKHQKPTSQTNTGGIIDKEMPIPVANVAIICSSCGKPTRIGHRFEPDGTKVRICRKCGGDLA